LAVPVVGSTSSPHTKFFSVSRSAKVGIEDVFKPAIGNESLHEISNDDEIRVANFVSSKRN
jgi:hypothetical protein